MTASRAVPASVSSTDAISVLIAIRELLHIESSGEAASRLCATVRQVLGSDGATLVLREGDQVYYAEEDAVGPLWRGRRFPAETCISGWAAMNRETAVIENIYDDPRIPAEAYRPTFVKSLSVAPVVREQAIGALGAYWSYRHRATEREVWLLEQIAEAAHAVCRRMLGTQESPAPVPEGAHARLLAVVAHDLRQPLSSIAYAAHLLMADEAPSSRQIAKQLARSASQASGLIREVSNFAELAREGLRLQLEPVSLDELCDALAAELDPERRRVCVEHEPTCGLLDGDRIRQALANLVRNALEHGDSNYPVTLRVSQNGALARIGVHNHGPAIPKDHQRSLIEPFQKFSDSEFTGSLGLGLYIVDQIVRAHGGRLELESSPEQGTTFQIVVPLAPTTLMTG